MGTQHGLGSMEQLRTLMVLCYYIGIYYLIYQFQSVSDTSVWHLHCGIYVHS